MKSLSHNAVEEARQFFLQRLRQQAAAEAQPLSQLELSYLDYSRIVGDEESNRLEEEFEAKYDSDEFADRIAELVEAALKQDAEENPRVYKQYKQRLKALQKSERDWQLAELVGGGIIPSPRERLLKNVFWGILGVLIVLATLWSQRKH